MVQLKGKTRLATSIEPVEGRYEITEVSEQITAVQSFKGIRVKLKSLKKGEEKVDYATMLWSREEASQTSKLGSFIKAFTDFFNDEDMALDTSNWVGKNIRITSWASKKREIEVIQ